MQFAIRPCLVIPSDGENREINAESDENGAKAHADHAQPPEKKLARSKRYQTREKKTKRHARQRQPSAKPGEKNDAHEHDSTKQWRDEILAHAQRNYGYKRRAPGCENLQRPAAVASFNCG